MRELKIGDIVTIKSGGPDMTVSQVIGYDEIEPKLDIQLAIQGFTKGDVVCQWFDGNIKYNDTFKREIIKLKYK